MTLGMSAEYEYGPGKIVIKRGDVYIWADKYDAFEDPIKILDRELNKIYAMRLPLENRPMDKKPMTHNPVCQKYMTPVAPKLPPPELLESYYTPTNDDNGFDGDDEGYGEVNTGREELVNNLDNAYLEEDDNIEEDDKEWLEEIHVSRPSFVSFVFDKLKNSIGYLATSATKKNS